MDEVTRTKVGDYYIPNLALPEDEIKITLGRWGMEHKKWLKANKPILYSKLMIETSLFRHCKEVEMRARKMFESLTQQMAKVENINENLKATDQMAWVGAMNNIIHRATEIVLKEVVYDV